MLLPKDILIELEEHGEERIRHHLKAVKEVNWNPVPDRVAWQNNLGQVVGLNELLRSQQQSAGMMQQQMAYQKLYIANTNIQGGTI